MTITLEQARTTMTEVIIEFGSDLHYKNRAWDLGAPRYVESPGTGPSCKYVIGGEPACLIGVIMHRLGYDIDTLMEWDVSDDGSFERVAERDGLDVESDAVVYLREAQRVQDNDGTWGGAQTTAEEFMRHPEEW